MPAVFPFTPLTFTLFAIQLLIFPSFSVVMAFVSVVLPAPLSPSVDRETVG